MTGQDRCDLATSKLVAVVERARRGGFVGGTGCFLDYSFAEAVCGAVDGLADYQAKVYQRGLLIDLLTAFGCPWPEGCHIPQEIMRAEAAEHEVAALKAQLENAAGEYDGIILPRN